MRNLFILRGAPASGKSTWVKTNGLEPYTLSADNIRCLYQSPITTVTGEREISQNNDTAVWKLLFELLERRMENGELVIVDATHYKSSLISRYKDLVHKYRYRVNVVDFSGVSEEECIKRNNSRDSYKKVPDDVIRKMYACLHDDSEVKKSYKILTPEQAATLINSPLEPVKCEAEKVVIFGDIHGCYEPLKEYFDKNPFNDNYCYIFCGDYIDRGLQNKEVLEFLLSIYNKSNVFLLEGNHEKWLRLYSSKDYVEPEKLKESYQDFYVAKLIEQLKCKKAELSKKINKNKNIMEELSKLLKESWNENPENREVFYEFEKVNVPNKQKELGEQNSKFERDLEVLNHYIYILGHEKNNTKNSIEGLCEWYRETLGEGISLSAKNLIMKKLNLKDNSTENPIKSPEFLKNTVPQIKDLDKAQLRQLCDKFIQMSYFTFNCHDYLVTHAGLSSLPDMKTPTIEMIKGVGKYEEHEKVDKQFVDNEEKNKTYTVQIHGHRNVLKAPVVGYKNAVFNLEGGVEDGGCLRILELGTFKDGHWNEIEIKNNLYRKEEDVVTKEKTDIELLKSMLHNKYIQVKELENNVISYNFTRDAFNNNKWSEETCTARGLFVDKFTGNVVARSFSKFFNHSQVDETTTAGLKENFKFPVVGYKKENGFLGIVSKYDGGIYFFTKSSDQGDYVNWFIGVLCDNYGIELEDAYADGSGRNMSYTEHWNDLSQNEQSADGICQLLKDQLIDKLNPFIKEGYSYVFECVDKDNDPHIIKYSENKVFLLEVFKNQLEEAHLSYASLVGIAAGLNVPVKQKELEFYSWEEFEEWKDKFTTGITQWDCKHEGYVFEDSNGFRVKFKSSFYKFWKQMRTVKEILASGRQNKKVYKTKEEIQVVKLLEAHTREELQKMSIIDIEDEFYEKQSY